ncbi:MULTISPECIES: hypothetical protein [Pantoea]|uniref:hypothetical protein n=1 Tax=Pantoea TaxID=53335 RepID=UPI00257A405B|nr:MULTISPECIES: hypothetical protein [Pantoea]MDU5473336.1 hypothetical protein [Pantoea sp.]
MEAYPAISAAFADLVRALSAGSQEQVDTASQEEILEMYLLIGALIQWKYCFKISL